MSYMNTSKDAGQKIYSLANSIFPICRSITGKGVRETLSVLSEYIKEGGGPEIVLHQVPSGTRVFDWTVPREWDIRQAYIENEEGERIIDMSENNLHVMGYSTPVNAWVDLDELNSHIFTQPDQPDVIPYVTSYYKERYGFCMSERQKSALQPGKYHMVIDSTLEDGTLTYGEVILPGSSSQEVFFSTNICHPSMANNECSGPALLAELIRFFGSLENRKYTYRCIFVPETIGSITYLSKNIRDMKERVIAGFNLSCVGDNRDYSMIESRYGDTLADRVMENALKFRGPYTKYSFLERGSDERQYNAPGVDLPVIGFCRSKFGEYPEYHTSADNMSLVSPEGFQGSYEIITQVVQAIEYNARYQVKVLCEPQLGKRGLYPTISQKGSYDAVKAMTDFIAYADGRNDLIDISNRIQTDVDTLIPIVETLLENHLISS